MQPVMQQEVRQPGIKPMKQKENQQSDDQERKKKKGFSRRHTLEKIILGYKKEANKENHGKKKAELRSLCKFNNKKQKE